MHTDFATRRQLEGSYNKSVQVAITGHEGKQLGQGAFVCLLVLQDLGV